MYGFGAGWGLYEYPGWSVSDVNYTDQLDQSNVQTPLQNIVTSDEDNAASQQV